MKKITATQKVILEFYMEIWYCYAYENGSMANPLFTSTSYELADAEAKDAGYEVVQVIEFEDEEEPAPTPTSKEGLEDRGFTPGEWEASYNSEEFPGQAAIYGCDGDTNGRVIAVLDTSDQTDMANIDLICAAPIMYDLLKWVVNEIETTPDELSDALLGMIKIKCNQLFTRINKH